LLHLDGSEQSRSIPGEEAPWRVFDASDPLWLAKS
jgi:hypothetical protein